MENIIEISEDSTESEAMKKYIISKIGHGMSVNSDITMETIMKYMVKRVKLRFLLQKF